MVIYGALSFPEGIASGESASTVGCCRLLSSASISCCRLHRLLWAAPSTCPITARALGSGSGRCGSRSGPPSEIFPRKFPRRHWLVIECGVAASGDVVCLWRCCCLSAVLAARQAMLLYPTLPLLHRSRVHLRLSSSVLAVHLHLHGLVLRHRRTAMFCASRRDSSSRRSARRTSGFTACASPSLGFTPLAASAPSCLVSNLTLLSCSSWWCSPLRFR